MNIKTIQKFKQRYLESCHWSDGIKKYIEKLDFSKILTNGFKIPENVVRKQLVELLIQENFTAKDILRIIVNDQKISLTTIGLFFKSTLKNNFYFQTEISLTEKKLKESNIEPTIQNVIQFYANKLHKCKMCNNLTYRIYCSAKCMGKDPERQKKIEDTCFKNNGVKNPIQSEEIRKRIEKTNLNRYGASNPFGSGQIQQKIKKTNIERYGGENVMNKKSPIRKIAEDTMQKKYGVRYFNNKEKAIQTNLKKLGVEYYTQHNFKNFDKLTKEFVTEHFVDKDKNRFLMTAFQQFFNLSQTIAYRYKKRFGFLMPSLHKRHSKPQLKLFDSIKANDKLFNDRTVIKPLELDIVIPHIKLAIEYDGIYWHSTTMSDIPNKHLTKLELCEEKGYQLFHIFSSDDIEIWKSIINSRLGLVKRIFARKCKVINITSMTAKTFCDINHLQGGVDSSINIGLQYKNELVAVMTFSKPRFNKNYQWELVRYCQLKNTRVIGGASKLLKNFTKSFKGNIISYANRRWSNGNLYRALGFKFVRNTNPGFFYTKNGQIYSRMSLQKHKLKNLKSYNSNLTAEKILQLEGFQKIYDCGNQVWELVYESLTI